MHSSDTDHPDAFIDTGAGPDPDPTSVRLQPREGDIVRTKDGHLWRVTRIHTGVKRVAAITRLGDHIEMAALPEDLTVVEAHPGGQQ